MTLFDSERRQHARRPAQGLVTIRVSGTDRPEVQGRLLDLSEMGFRMAHDSPNLETGLLVDFVHAGATGKARVVWNRILDGKVETGFHVTQQTLIQKSGTKSE